jgi:hypothetical protein
MRGQNKIIEQLRKVKILGERALLCKKMKNACGVTDTAWKIWRRVHNLQTIRSALSAFKGNIYQKHICPAPWIQKYINLRGLSNKKFPWFRCHWYLMPENRRLKSRLSSRIRSRIQKGCNPWIRGSEGIVWWKKILWHCPFNIHCVHYSNTE